ncbi:MAG: tRNA (adenosine(37)-N6)-threonylcarbamoyltransferase complex dimerization subunit type 1 TsaB [Deltaproteobacteria bacterium]|nr:tRNA (adenosine(37)-N6)-threonylcarbamoyltransferase complex dimerization subunit type 1 TsaB [Deltaproteobacteria bacterium]
MAERTLDDGLWLALSTVTDVESAGLFRLVDGVATPVEQHRQQWRRGAARQSLAQVDALLRAAAPEALVGVVAELGPGSFTGVRLGLAVARTLAFVDGVPLVGVASFDVARRLVGDPDVAVALPARPRHAYLDVPGVDARELPITALDEAIGAHTLVVASGLATGLRAASSRPFTSVDLPDLVAVMAVACDPSQRRGSEPIYVGVSEAERKGGVQLPDGQLPVRNG